MCVCVCVSVSVALLKAVASSERALRVCGWVCVWVGVCERESVEWRGLGRGLEEVGSRHTDL